MTFQIATINGSTVEFSQENIDDFSAKLRGQLLTNMHPDYEQLRQVWNGMIEKHPALIIQCHGTADVITSVKFAYENALLISVKGGGHNIAGSAVCENGIMIDLSLMKGVIVDPIKRTAQVQPGCVLGDVDHETQHFGLAVPTGINSTTGIAGLALGGGYGWLSRAYGHTVDNIISVDLVTANGEFLHLSETENEDLFWAIRGGSGNFGIVTKFEFKLHPIGPNILSGLVIYPLAQAEQVLNGLAALSKDMPDEASCWSVIRKAPPFPFVPEAFHGQSVLVLAMSYIGDLDDGEKALAPIRALGESLADLVQLTPYLVWQSAFDPLLTEGARNYWKSSDFVTLDQQVYKIIIEAANSMPSDECEIFIAQLGGAAARVSSDAMAYPHRDTAYTMNIHGRWRSQDLDSKGIRWVRELFEAVEKFATGSVYVNFIPEHDEVRKIGPYGENIMRLEQIKGQVDPKNMFQTNINITPKM